MSKRRIFPLAVALLSFLYAAVLLAGFVAPYDPAEQDREYPFAPPTHLHFIDAQGTLHAWPFTYALTSSPDNFAQYQEDRGRVFPLRFFVAGENYSLLGFVACHRHLYGVDEPGRLFLLGTDGYGRDQFSRLLWGGRISLLAGLIAATLSLSMGNAGGRSFRLLRRICGRCPHVAGRAVPGRALVVPALCGASIPPLAHRSHSRILAGGGSDRNGGLGETGTLDSRGCAQRQGEKIRAGSAWIRRLTFLSSPAARSAANHGRFPDTSGPPRPPVHPCRSDSFLPRTWSGRTGAELGQHARIPPAISHPGQLLVDVGAGARSCSGVLGVSRPSGLPSRTGRIRALMPERLGSCQGSPMLS